MEERQPIDVLIQVLAQNTEASKFGVTPEESISLAKHIHSSCPFLNFRGIMSMGQIGNEDEFRLINELKVKMLDEFKDTVKED